MKAIVDLPNSRQRPEDSKKASLYEEENQTRKTTGNTST